MLIKLRQSKAQSIIEYVVLVGVISVALLAMYPYLRRAVNARLKQVQVEMDEWRR